MTDVNRNMMRACRLIKEHIKSEKRLEELDVATAGLEAQVEANDRMAAKLVLRQDEIVEELAPALSMVGPVVWRDDGKDFVVRLAIDSTDHVCIKIEELHTWGKLAAAMPERVHSDAQIVEAALHAAFEDLDRVPAMDDRPDRLPIDAYIAHAGRNGRQAVIANGVTVIDQEAG